eukprot:1140397-Pelagomonas_calceolata.AAC.1
MKLKHVCFKWLFAKRKKYHGWVKCENAFAHAVLRGSAPRMLFQISMLPFNNYNTLCPSFYSASSSGPGTVT